MNKQVVFEDLGMIDYQKSWDYQEKLFREVVDLKIANRSNPIPVPTPNYLLFCQHPHVYTIGKSGDLGNLLVDQKGLDQRNATFYKINRGGDITYHGPGQLVGYPILDLDNFFTDIHLYLRTLEEAVIRTLSDYDISAGRIDGLTGVWLDFETENSISPRKICALGVRTSRWVTMHGFSFNVNTDLDYFSNIVPCGIQDKAVTSMSHELGAVIELKEVSEKLRQHLADLFQMDLKESRK